MTADRLPTVVPKGKLLPVGVGDVTDEDDLSVAMVADHPGAAGNLGRWFLDSPLLEDGTAWVLSKMWGANTAEMLDRLLTLAPGHGWSATAVPAYDTGQADDVNA